MFSAVKFGYVKVEVEVEGKKKLGKLDVFVTIFYHEKKRYRR